MSEIAFIRIFNDNTLLFREIVNWFKHKKAAFFMHLYRAMRVGSPEERALLKTLYEERNMDRKMETIAYIRRQIERAVRQRRRGLRPTWHYTTRVRRYVNEIFLEHIAERDVSRILSELNNIPKSYNVDVINSLIEVKRSEVDVLKMIKAMIRDYTPERVEWIQRIDQYVKKISVNIDDLEEILEELKPGKLIIRESKTGNEILCKDGKIFLYNVKEGKIKDLDSLVIEITYSVETRTKAAHEEFEGELTIWTYKDTETVNCETFKDELEKIEGKLDIAARYIFLSEFGRGLADKMELEAPHPHFVIKIGGRVVDPDLYQGSRTDYPDALFDVYIKNRGQKYQYSCDLSKIRYDGSLPYKLVLIS